MAQLKTARKRQNDRKSFYCVYSRTNESRSVKLTIAYWLSFFLSFFFLGHRKLLLFWQKFGVFVFVRAHFVSATLLPTFVRRDQLHKTLFCQNCQMGVFFLFFIFSILLTVCLKFVNYTGFELWTSGIGSSCCTNYSTTTLTVGSVT